MVGNIGALHTPPVGPIEKATELALALITGWAKKDHDKFAKILGELQDAAKNNAAVYKQASEALNDLSRREKAAKELEASARAAHEQALTAAETVQRVTAEGRGQLEIDQEAQAALVRSNTEMFEERERRVSVRETVVSRGETENARLQQALTAKAGAADKLSAEAESVLAKQRSQFARVKAIIEES